MVLAMDQPKDVVLKPIAIYTIGGSSLARVVEFFAPLHAQVEDLRVTAYLAPDVVGSVHDRPHWLDVGILGWDGHPGECLSWTADQTEERVLAAIDRGFVPTFMAPWDLFDLDTLEGINRARVRIHRGLRVRKSGFVASLGASFDPLYRQLATPEGHPFFTPESLLRFNHFARAATVLAEEPIEIIRELTAASPAAGEEDET